MDNVTPHPLVRLASAEAEARWLTERLVEAQQLVEKLVSALHRTHSARERDDAPPPPPVFTEATGWLYKLDPDAYPELALAGRSVSTRGEDHEPR